MLTERLWISTRNRRSFNPPLPAVPVTLEVEMAYNPHFKGLHNAADTLSSVLRRQRLAHSYGGGGSDGAGSSNINNNYGSDLSRWRKSLTKKRTMMVTVPPGYYPGDSLEFSTEDGTNRTAAIVIPPGAVEGQKLKANVPPMSPREASTALMATSASRQPQSLAQLQGEKQKQQQQREEAMQTLMKCAASSNSGGSGLQRQTVGELKQLAAAAGVSLAGCLEKEDVVERLTRAAAAATKFSNFDATSSTSEAAAAVAYDADTSSSSLPCPPGFDHEVWLNLPRPLQEEALEDLAKRYQAKLRA